MTQQGENATVEQAQVIIIYHRMLTVIPFFILPRFNLIDV